MCVCLSCHCLGRKLTRTASLPSLLLQVIKRMHPKPPPPVSPSSPIPPSPSSTISQAPSAQNSPLPSSSETSPLPTVAPLDVNNEASLHKTTSRVTFSEGPHKDKETSTPLVSSVVPESEAHDMMSFIDLLFGGRLASMIVCETCKSVSRRDPSFLKTTE